MTWVMKALILVIFAFIFFSLGSALYFLVSKNHNSDRMIKALTWRVVLSVILFVFLLIGFALGWITPHPI